MRRKKKRELIDRLRKNWEKQGKRGIKRLSLEFGICPETARNYLNMTDEELEHFLEGQKRNRASSVMDAYDHIIYKMQRDGLKDDIIYFYIKKKGYPGNAGTLWRYIQYCSENNFPGRVRMQPIEAKKGIYPESVTVIKRVNLLRYLFTANPRTLKDPAIDKNVEEILKHYPSLKKAQQMFRDFYKVIMGKDPEALEEYLDIYGDTELKGFCEEIKKDIAPIKNAISFEESSGFVEGNNNKLKLIKHIVYGRSNLVNLSKKCLLAFAGIHSYQELKELLTYP